MKRRLSVRFFLTIFVFLLSVVRAAGSSPVAVTLAPDQRIPLIFVGEPLIIEWIAEHSMTVDIEITVTSEKGESTHLTLSGILLRPKRPYWHAFDDVARKMGRYRVSVTTRTPVGAAEFQGEFCRIERPSIPTGKDRKEDAPPILGVSAQELFEGDLAAWQSVGVTNVTLAMSMAGLETILETAIADGFRVCMSVDPALDPDLEHVAEVAKLFAGRVSRWEVSLNPAVLDKCLEYVNVLHDSASGTPVYLAADSPDVVRESLQRLAHKGVDGLVLLREGSSAEFSVFQRSVQLSGVERTVFVARYLFGDGSGENNPGLTDVLRDVAQGAAQVSIPGSLLYAGGKFGDLYVSASVLNKFLQDTSFLAALPTGTPHQFAYCFRKYGAWRIVLGTSSSGDDTIALPIGNADNLQMRDGAGNEVPVPPLDNQGLMKVSLGRDLVYISGKGGLVLWHAAMAAAREAARSILENETFRGVLPSEFSSLLNELITGKTQKLDKTRFFVLARTFPFLEHQYAVGAITQEVCLGLQAELSRLLRPLCVLEQESGEPFIEPLQDILSRCSQYQSSYLTRSTGTALERGNWLLAEVGRLVTEAKALAEQDRDIEAAALAIVAEWRARSLDFLGDGTEKPQPQPQTPLQMEQSKPEEKAPSAEITQAPAKKIAVEPSSEPDSTVRPQKYKVEKGDNPSKIARKHGVTLQKLLEWNGWDSKKRLQIGDEYVIYK